MDSPAISRSGRVLKKSFKLLDMETDAKQGRTNAKQMKTSMDSSLLNSTSNTNIDIKTKLNLSGEVQPSQYKNSVISSLLPKIETFEVPINQPTTTAIENTNVSLVKPSSVESLIIKIKNENKEETISNMTPVITNKQEMTESEKRIKLSGESEQKIIIHNRFSNDSNIIKIQTQQQQQQQPFKTKLSPIVQVNKDKFQKSFATSTPKINTIISSKFILPRSIQEQRRINQANRAKMQQQPQQQQPLIQKPQISHTVTTNSLNHSVNLHPGIAHHGDEDSIKQKAKKPTISAYVLWCKENRSHIQSNYPELDFINLSKKMGEIWHTLPQNEKDTWFKKARIIKYNSNSSGMNASVSFNCFYDDKDLKPEIVLGSLTLPIAANLDKTFSENFLKNSNETYFEGEIHRIGTELIDVQAYLSILGDSLMTIGSYIQRGIKYNSEINYSPMAAVSTLLDTALVSMASMASVTLAIPNASINKEKMKETMDNVTFFMPPSEF